MQYKINQPIYIRYLELEKEEGLTDLKLTPTNPSGVDQTPITFSELGDGLYQASFTPNATGWWQVRVNCVSKPGNIWSADYFVGTEYTTYPTQEDGKISDIKDNTDIIKSPIETIGDNIPAKALLIGGKNENGKLTVPKVCSYYGVDKLIVLNYADGLSQAINGRMFQCCFEYTIPTQAETDIALFKSPIGNTKDILIDKIIIDVLSKGNQCSIRIYSQPTITADGTPLLIYNRLNKGTPPTSTINGYHTPTISNRGILTNVFSAGVDANSLVNSIDGTMIFGAGRDVLITGAPTGNNTIVAITIIWMELII